MSDFFTNTERFAPARTLVERRQDGVFIMESPEQLESHERCIGEWLDRWSEEKPDTVFLAEKREGDWFRLSYADVRRRVGALAQGLLDLGLDDRQPLVVLSENDIDHAHLALAAQYVGIPIASVSVAYSRNPKAFDRLQVILDALNPGAIYLKDAEAYSDLLELMDFKVPVIAAENPGSGDGVVDLAGLYDKVEGPDVSAAFGCVTPETPARYLLTSGSTGEPKVVINTHRMLCANQQAIRQCWRFLKEEEVTVLDWLPWSHTFGANHNFNLVLSNGGSLYIDEGRPVAGLLERTVQNLKDVRPTLLFNVPRGYEALLPLLESDQELREALFGRLSMLFYAAAALPQYCWDRLLELAATVRREPLFIASEWGSTETSPVLTSVHFECDSPGNLGLPVPGVSIKFVPSGDKLEMRVKGPSVFTEYLNAPDLTAAAFDEEGYYRIGDAGHLIDEGQPEKGIRFNGRVTEDFKLTSGTWVSVGTIRPALVSALSPYAQDCVIAGHDQDMVGALIFVTPALRNLAGEGRESMSGDELAAIPAVRSAILSAIKAFAKECPGSSRHPQRVLLLGDAPSLESGELTDKGYLNQRNALRNRDDQVARLFVDIPDSAVISLSDTENEECQS